MTTNNNQPEPETSTFTKGQEVWIPARIVNPKPDRDGDIKLYITSTLDMDWEAYCHPSKIRTTEQILMEEAIKNDLKSDKFRVYIDDVRQGLNYYYLYAPDGTEHVYPKECFSPREVIEICDAENAKIASQNAKPTTISKPETVTETPHFDEKTPHNAEQNAEPTTISNTETVTEPDRTRKFRKGDKVRVVERWGRPLQDQEDFEDWGFKLNEVYEVAGDEDCENAVKLIDGEHFWYFPFYVLDLVEPAPEAKYLLHESTKTYSIYYKGEKGKVLAAMILRKNLYTLEEAHEQLDKLILKDQDNGI